MPRGKRYKEVPTKGASVAGIFAGIFAAGFGVFWLVGASSAGAPPFFILFGMIFILVALVTIGIHVHNAGAEPEQRITGKTIYELGEESDEKNDTATQAQAFCHSCGKGTQNRDRFCSACGTALRR